jgi:hypothetical protein
MVCHSGYITKLKKKQLSNKSVHDHHDAPFWLLIKAFPAYGSW